MIGELMLVRLTDGTLLPGCKYVNISVVAHVVTSIYKTRY